MPGQDAITLHARLRPRWTTGDGSTCVGCDEKIWLKMLVVEVLFETGTGKLLNLFSSVKLCQACGTVFMERKEEWE